MKICRLKRGPQDGLQRRTAPIPGRSNVEEQTSRGKCGRTGTVGACCVRGRAHSVVGYPAYLAVLLAASLWAVLPARPADQELIQLSADKTLINADKTLIADRHTEKGFKTLFNGKNLTGWDG